MEDFRPAPPGKKARPRSAQARAADRVRISHTARGVKPWSPWVGVNAGSETGWLKSVSKEMEEFSSTALASEVILKQIYTNTGGGNEDGQVGGPTAKRTAVACLLLYHIAHIFGRYGALLRCLLRDIVMSVYVTTEDDASSLWDSLASSDHDFFKKRAQFEVERFLKKPLYYDEARKLRRTAEQCRLDTQKQHVKRLEAKLVFARILDREETQLQRRVFKWWRLFCVFARQIRVISLRNKNVTKNFTRSVTRLRQKQILTRCFLALKQSVLNTKTTTSSRVRQELEGKSADLFIKAEEAKHAMQTYKWCLKQWAQWASSIINEREDETDPQTEGEAADEEEPTPDSHVKAFEELSPMVYLGIKADIEQSTKPSKVPRLPQAVLAQFRDTSIPMYDQVFDSLFSHYAVKLDGRWVLTVFDMARVAYDCKLLFYKNVILDAFVELSVAKGEHTGVFIFPKDLQVLFLNIGLATKGKHRGLSALHDFMIADIIPNVKNFSEPSAFSQIMRDESVIRAVLKYGKPIRNYFSGKADPIAYIESLQMPRITPQVLVSICDALRLTTHSLHPVDIFMVLVALSQVYDPLPFLPCAKRLATFVTVLLNAVVPKATETPTAPAAKPRRRSTLRGSVRHDTGT